MDVFFYNLFHIYYIFGMTSQSKQTLQDLCSNNRVRETSECVLVVNEKNILSHLCHQGSSIM